MKRAVKFLAYLLSITIVVTMVGMNIDSKNVVASSETYSIGNNGAHPLYTDKNSLCSYVEEMMVSRVPSFTVYYAFNNVSDIRQECISVVNNAISRRALANSGDYLERAFSSYSYTYLNYGSYYNGYSTILCLTYSFNYYTTSNEEAMVTSKVDSIIAGLNIAGASEYEKTLAIYNWITSNVVYDYTNAALPKAQRNVKTFTAYGALYNGTAVCQGISTLFYQMLNKVGIDNRVVYSANHCWNIVRISGTYYYCDVTWDLGVKNYSYFLRGADATFLADHQADPQSTNRGYTVSSVSYNSNSTVNASDNSTVQVLNFVERLYTVVLGRPSESAGKTSWSNELLDKKVNGVEIAKSFVMSEEYINKNTSNEEFVVMLYRAFFDREEDDEGFNFWMNELANGSTREEVLVSFINSDEWSNVCSAYGINSGNTKSSELKVRGFVERLYLTALGREYDQSGLDYWTNTLTGNLLTGSTVAHDFFFCKETEAQNISNEELLNRMYVTFMNRQPDTDGYNFWLSELYSGVTRETVFNGFVTSEEFVKICQDCGITAY